MSQLQEDYLFENDKTNRSVCMKKIISVLCLMMLCFSAFAMGQGETGVVDMSKYPSKPITFIVNRAAGGSTDLIARAVANSIQQDKGFTTTVTNYDGGDGLIGVNELMNAAPDGYTFGVIGCTEIPNMLANFEEAAFTKDDLYPVCQLASKSRILVCAPNSPFKTLDDMKEYALANPGKLTCAVAGSNTMYLPEILERELGIDLTIVNAGSGNNAFTMVLGGHSDIAVIGANFYKNAKAEGCAVLGDSMPVDDLGEGFAPTFISQGVNFTDTSFTYIIAAKGTPEEYIKYMSDLIKDCIDNGTLYEGLQNAKQSPVFMPYEEFRPFFLDYVDDMMPILKK